MNLLSEQVAVVGIVPPDATAAGAVSSAWISMASYNDLMAIIFAGALGTNATVDAKLQQAKDSSGTGAKDVTGKAITQLTQAGTDKSNKQAIINMTAAELDRANAFTHVRLTVTVAVATSDVGAVLLAGAARYGPTTQAASVDQVVK